MKILLSFAVLLAIASCKVYIMDVGSQCSQELCVVSQYQRYSNLWRCPTTGKYSAKLIINDGVFYFISFPKDFIRLELQKINDPSSNGIQYYHKMETPDSLVIFNCSIPAAQKYTDLCSQHDFVVGKMHLSSFTDFRSCFFSMDIIQEEEITL